MALVTFSDSTSIVAADVNSNFHDEENNEVAARQGRHTTQRYRLGVKDLDTTLVEGRRSLIIKPISFAHVYVIDVLIDDAHASGNTPSALTVELECLTTPRALNNKTQTATISSGQATPYETTISFEGTPLVLLPGLTYRLRLVGTGTPNDWTEVVLTTYRPRSNS